MIADSTTISTRFPTMLLLVGTMPPLSPGLKPDTQSIVILEIVQPLFHLFIGALFDNQIRTLAKYQTVIRDDLITNKSLCRYFDVVTQARVTNNYASCVQANILANSRITAPISAYGHILPKEQPVGIARSS